MKRIIHTLLVALALTSATYAQVNVQKTSGTNAITGNIVVGDGKSITASGTGSISASSVAVSNITGAGTGVLAALANATNASGGLLTYSGNIGAATATSVTFSGGGAIAGAGGDVTLTPSSGVVKATFATFTHTLKESGGVGYIYILPTATAPSGGNYSFARDGSGNTYLSANGTLQIFSGGTLAATLSGAQLLQLNAYGAGTLTTDSSGNVTAISDERMKNIMGDFSTGLKAVRQLAPKYYTWKKESGLNTSDVVVSLIAQNLIEAGVPEAVNTFRTVPDTELVWDSSLGQMVAQQKKDAQGNPVVKKIDATYTVSDRAVIALLVNAIKELDARVTTLELK